MSTPTNMADLAGFDAWLKAKIDAINAEIQSGKLDFFDTTVVRLQASALDSMRQELLAYQASSTHNQE